MIFIFFIIFIYILFYVNNNVYLISDCYKKSKIDNILKLIEKDFSKKYPLNDNFFTITHYPKYLDFFSNFKSYKYYVYIKNNKILGTCCFAKFKKLKNINVTYVCDLKSFIKGKNMTYYFFKKYMLDNLDYKIFGITMLPNPVINKLKIKYFFKEYDILNLYEIEYNKILLNLDNFNDYFGEFSFCYGNKILNIYDKNNNLIENKKIIHICRKNNDIKYIDIKYIDIQLHYDEKIMFCIPHKHNFVKLLKNIEINPINKMSIIGFGLKISVDIKNFEFIETHMI